MDSQGLSVKQETTPVDERSGFQAHRLERVFAQCFSRKWQTRLVGGASEPLYEPTANADEYHLLHYREDFFASALHETAHWCIAGELRRRQLDFGYWYAPDGRDDRQQQAFERVEVKPQALEWLFSLACGYRFTISIDNLSKLDCGHDSSWFQRQVLEQAQHWQSTSLPARGLTFYTALTEEFKTGLDIGNLDLALAALTR